MVYTQNAVGRPISEVLQAGRELHSESGHAYSNLKLGSEGQHIAQPKRCYAKSEMLDLNDLRVFAYVASLSSFSSAAEALQIHKSSVSRSVARLETTLHTPLIQRSTRKVRLTLHGIALKNSCVDMLEHINATIGYAGVLSRDASNLRGFARPSRPS